jgi:hypothetical protein
MRMPIWLLRSLPHTALATALVSGGCSDPGSGASPRTVEGMRLVGTVDMKESEDAHLGSGSTGNGALLFNRQRYPFTVSGLGVGGIGVASIDAEGEVYGLRNVRQFPGTYVQGRYGFALLTESAGDLWLRNENGVVLRLKTKREGLMLSLSGHAVAINMVH